VERVTVKNSRVWAVTELKDDSPSRELGNILATSVEQALKTARQCWPHAGPIRVRVKR
jgi:hypothetical protein